METVQMEDLVPSPDRPKLLFEEGSYTLPELLESHLLPVVVQYDVESHPLPFSESSFDLSRPLLLYKKRNIQKVSARSLHIQNGRYEEVGDSLLIPEDYKGWFSVLARMTGSSIIDDNVPHFATVEDLAVSNTERFLIGGTKRLTGLEINDRSAGILDHTERHLFPGDILTREKIFFGETKKKTRLFRKPKYIIEKFLMCRDEADNEVLLPFEQQGIFYQVSHKGGKAHKNVLQMSDIVARKMTPRLIKLVFGRFPVTPCAFTGLMRAESSDIETSVIACTLVNTKNILLELPVTSVMHFRIALTNDHLRLNPCYRSAIGQCAERANTYMRNIKVCVNFNTDDDEPQDPEEDFISKRNRSNSFDIDAIQSSPRKAKSNAIKKSYSSLKRPNGSKTNEGYFNTSSRDLRLSESLSSSVHMRPGRCHSTGRMSFCLGNNYLTVPLYASGAPDNRNSGNNNSIYQSTCTSKIGSRISFNGKFFEEETNGDDTNRAHTGGDSDHNTTASSVEIPPSLPCTNISAYVNLIDPPTSPPSGNDYIPAASYRKPSSHAPDAPPPPLPVSSSSSGEVSFGSASSIVGDDQAALQHKVQYESEYAVPKLGERSEVLNVLQGVSTFSAAKQPMSRRPSTFTFSEGCLNLNKRRGNQCLPSPGECDSDFEDDGVIYENVTTLMEEVAAKEQLLEEETINDKSHNTEGNEAEENVHELNDIDNVNGRTYERQDSHILFDLNEDNENTDDDNGCTFKDIPQSESDSDYTIKDIPQSENDSNCTLNDIPESEIDSNRTSNDIPESQRHPDHTFNDITQSESGPDHGSDPSETRTRKCGVVNTVQPCMTELLDSANSEILNEPHNDSRNELEETPPTQPSDDRRDDSGDKTSDNGNGKLWLSGLRKTAGVDTRVFNPQNSLDEEDIKLMPTAMIIEKLKLIGIKEATIHKLKELRIDGSVLCDILNGDKPISECLVGINLVDQQKISMFVRGWRPDMDYI